MPTGCPGHRAGPPARSPLLIRAVGKGGKSLADVLAQRKQRDVLGLHLGQHLQIVVLAGQLRPDQRPQRIVLDLMVVMELLVDELPVGGQLARPGRVHPREPARQRSIACRSRRNASWIKKTTVNRPRGGSVTAESCSLPGMGTSLLFEKRTTGRLRPPTAYPGVGPHSLVARRACPVDYPRAVTGAWVNNHRGAAPRASRAPGRFRSTRGGLMPDRHQARVMDGAVAGPSRSWRPPDAGRPPDPDSVEPRVWPPYWSEMILRRSPTSP